ncbi:MAG: GNAT family N-acetyltransferase [Chloroflexota bacterium]|nr:GNAT family N-acetyltransferase [Chloroflexota bacterium]
MVHLLQRAACLYPENLALTPQVLLDLPLLLTAWEGERLQGCLGVSFLHPPAARIEAFLTRYRRDAGYYLGELLPPVEAQLRGQGIEVLVYIGQAPWLIPLLKRQGFQKTNSILRLHKQGWEIPTLGNLEVCIRPARPEDIPALVSLDETAFQEVIWQRTADVFQQLLPVHRTTDGSQMPHFVVAERRGQVVGYQLSQLRGGEGHLTRVVVHPDAQGQRIGARLVAEAIRFFRGRGVRDITLNTQRDNYRAQQLYRWFGFRPGGGEVTVLQKPVPLP